MAARDHLNPNQLKLFMSPDELTSSVYPIDASTETDDWGQDDHAGMWSTKIGTAHDSGMIDDVKDRGVQEPVVIGFDRTKSFTTDGKTLLDGHHRTAAALVASQEVAEEPRSGVQVGGPSWLPVEYAPDHLTGEIIRGVHVQRTMDYLDKLTPSQMNRVRDQMKDQPT